MNFPPFWALGRQGDFSCWRWSHESLAAAQALAAQAARELAARFADGTFPDRLKNYYGTDRPMREPVMQEFRDGSGALSAVVTRNSYGSLVLNTARLMFVDVDAPESATTSAGGFFKSLFSRSKPQPAAGPNPWESQQIERARAWTQNHPGWGWRIYRTKAGLRLLASHAPGDPVAAETQAAFETLGADPLYRRLCLAQKCFRARLTPKYWRCGVPKPPGRWPYPSEAAMDKWLRHYAEAGQSYATCKLIATLGSEAIHPEIQPLLTTHDLTCKADSDLPLA